MLYPAPTLERFDTTGLENPNLHRILELSVYTISQFGHFRHVSDSIFETKHQPLKQNYLRDSHANNHEWPRNWLSTNIKGNGVKSSLRKYYITPIPSKSSSRNKLEIFAMVLF